MKSRNQKVLLLNSSSGIIQLCISILFTSISIPVFIRSTGMENYGFFTSILALGDVNILTNLGLNYSLVSSIGKQGKTLESDCDIVATVIILLIILLPLSLAMIFFRTELLSFVLNIKGDNLLIASKILLAVILSNVMVIIGQVFKAVLESLEKIYVINFIQITFTSFYWGGIIFVILKNYSLDKLSFVILLSNSVWFLLMIFFFLKFWGRIKINVFQQDLKRHGLRQIKYGYRLYIAQLVSYFYEPFSKILITNFFGFKYAAIIEISFRIRGILQALFSKLLNSISPRIAKTKFEGNSLLQRINFLEYSLFFYLIITCICIIFCTKYILGIWLDNSNIQLLYSVQILSISFLLFSVSNVPSYYYFALQNRTEVPLKMQLSIVIVNAISLILLSNILGFNAFLISSSLSIFSAFLVSLYSRKILSFEFVYDLKVPLIFAIILLFLGFIADNYLPIHNALFKLLFVGITISLSGLLLISKVDFFKKSQLLGFKILNDYI